MLLTINTNRWYQRIILLPKRSIVSHINEIANLNMYADDHQMYIVGSDMSIMCTNMEKEGNSALKWYKDNYLLSNPENRAGPTGRGRRIPFKSLPQITFLI